jgi:hypothetical protein
MAADSNLTISGLRARGVNVELERPIQTSGGEIPTAPLVLIDLETEEGTTGAPTSSHTRRWLSNPCGGWPRISGRP